MSQGGTERPQFDFIDGLRALCALYIVLHHDLQSSGVQSPWIFPLTYGFEVVVVFITISGFCLGLPLARRGQWELNAGQFYWRRIRRILPPYYAAVAIGLLIVAGFALHGAAQDYLGVPFAWPMVWSHLALVQNWMPDQMMTLDGPLWSIAVECQIYLFFPLLVLLRRRFGPMGTTLLWLVAVELLMVATRHGGDSGLLLPFEFGMIGADLAYRPAGRRWLVPCALIASVGVAVSHSRSVGLSNSLVGVAAALWMAYLAQVRGNLANRILGWKPLAWIGTFSYSLYLVHSYIQIGTGRWLAGHSTRWQLASTDERAGVLVLLTPVILAASYGFHVVFERPFMGSARQRAERNLTPHAVAELAALGHPLPKHGEPAAP